MRVSVRKQLREAVIAVSVWLQLLAEALLDVAGRALDSDACAAYVLVITMAIGGFLVGYAMAASH